MTTQSTVQGTTPTLIITLSDETIDLNEMAAVEVYIGQSGSARVVKRNGQENVVLNGNVIAMTLTQKETLSLKPGSATVQIRYLTKTGEAFANRRKAYISIGDLISKNVIEG